MSEESSILFIRDVSVLDRWTVMTVRKSFDTSVALPSLVRLGDIFNSVSSYEIDKDNFDKKIININGQVIFSSNK